jgi:hypothetical protein
VTQDEIIAMARQAGKFKDGVFPEPWIPFFVDFAKLVAAKEREACANLCWKNEDENAFANSYNGKRLDLLCAELIKAKGEQA